MRSNIIYNFFKEGADTNWGDVAFREENGNCRAHFTGNRWSGALWPNDDTYWRQDTHGNGLRADYWQGAPFRCE